MLIETARFVELEYNTLRTEIEKSKANMLKFIVGGSAIVPTAQYLADKFSIGAITLALPMIVVVLVLLFLAENRAMMRAGTYILTEIEPHVDGIKGWETWLSLGNTENRRARTVDKLVVMAFAIVAASYFLASVLLAGRYALGEFGEQGRYMFIGGYVFIGLVLVFVLYSQAQTDTKN